MALSKTAASDEDNFPRGYGQGCPIAVALDVLGDRWTLLILRDLSHAPLRFVDIQAINPGLSPNLLTTRLRRLEASGIIRRSELPPPSRAAVYGIEPSAREAVVLILNALGRFGGLLFARTSPPESAEPLLAQMRRNARWFIAKRSGVKGEFGLEIDGLRMGLSVGEHHFDPTPNPPADPVATIESTAATMAHLANGVVSLADAEASGRLSISGDRDAAVALIENLSLVPVQADR